MLCTHIVIPVFFMVMVAGNTWPGSTVRGAVILTHAALLPAIDCADARGLATKKAAGTARATEADTIILKSFCTITMGVKVKYFNLMSSTCQVPVNCQLLGRLQTLKLTSLYRSSALLSKSQRRRECGCCTHSRPPHDDKEISVPH